MQEPGARRAVTPAPADTALPFTHTPAQPEPRGRGGLQRRAAPWQGERLPGKASGSLARRAAPWQGERLPGKASGSPARRRPRPRRGTMRGGAAGPGPLPAEAVPAAGGARGGGRAERGAGIGGRGGGGGLPSPGGLSRFTLSSPPSIAGAEPRLRRAGRRRERRGGCAERAREAARPRQVSGETPTPRPRAALRTPAPRTPGRSPTFPRTTSGKCPNLRWGPSSRVPPFPGGATPSPQGCPRGAVIPGAGNWGWRGGGRPGAAARPLRPIPLRCPRSRAGPAQPRSGTGTQLQVRMELAAPPGCACSRVRVRRGFV
ncbi:PREDICTED: translation initiation factor IF-2-like [Lepidothrix coronata]|uniref:Translation initiation factor IF-2-like n=1 Tax=Lepidothrix coronata TaxID=321398 RepID=A0A6J0I8H4_9PASS|nr:PREDICTED: translation initiation factor IF-2-like [Lepidothrix coronata]